MLDTDATYTPSSSSSWYTVAGALSTKSGLFNSVRTVSRSTAFNARGCARRSRTGRTGAGDCRCRR